MLDRNLIGATALALAMAAADAQAFDQSSYPDWGGAWRRIPVPGVTGQPGYDQTKRLGPAQQAPLTPEAQEIMEKSMADQAKGGQGNYPTYICLSPGMPRRPPATRGLPRATTSGRRRMPSRFCSSAWSPGIISS